MIKNGATDSIRPQLNCKTIEKQDHQPDTKTFSCKHHVCHGLVCQATQNKRSCYLERDITFLVSLSLVPTLSDTMRHHVLVIRARDCDDGDPRHVLRDLEFTEEKTRQFRVVLDCFLERWNLFNGIGKEIQSNFLKFLVPVASEINHVDRVRVEFLKDGC